METYSNILLKCPCKIGSTVVKRLHYTQLFLFLLLSITYSELVSNSYSAKTILPM